MNVEQMRNRLKDIVAELEKFDGIELSAEQVENVNTYHAEFKDLSTKIESAEKMEEIKNLSKTSERKTTPKATYKVEVKDRHEKTGGFSSMGEFAKAIYNKSVGKGFDTRFQNATMFESVAEDGGILIPEDFMSDIKTKFDAQDSLLSRTTQFPVSGNSLSMPVDEEQPWNSGVTARWMEEGGQHTESKSKLTQASFRVHKLGAFITATDELLEDASSIEALIRKKAPQAMVSKVNNAIIDGTGVGQPKGLLSSGFKIAVAKESGQAADSVVYKNIVNMESRLIPGSNAVWIANPGVKPQLRQLKDDNGNHIYMNGGGFPNLAQAGFETLMGLPILYMPGGAKALGDEGDLILADLSYYYSIVKSGIKSDMSTHLYFDRDKTAFKFTMRLDGHCPFSSPVTTEYGAFDMSGIITLAERA